MQNNVILFDIDHTLFDTDTFLEVAFERLTQIFSYTNTPNLTDTFVAMYERMRGVEVFHPVSFATLVTKTFNAPEKKQIIVDIFEDQSLLDGCLYQDVRDVFTLLTKKDIRIGIFSTGEKAFQRKKIHSLRMFFEDKDIHIFPLKDKEIANVLKEYKSHSVTFVDDRQQVLEEVARCDSNLKTIWIYRKKPLKEHPASKNFSPTYRIKLLQDILPLVD